MADFAQEGGHFYLPNGEPFYTVIAKGSGKPRPATLRDARPLGAVPGVTTILRCADRPALTQWLQRQAILAALTLPRNEGEAEEEWLDRVLADSRQEGRDAADRGTEIHGSLERFYRDGSIDSLWCFPVNDLIMSNCGKQQWHPERSFASRYGYGGKVDLHSDGWVIDFKGTDKPLDTLKMWDEHYIQLAAYRRGLHDNRPFAVPSNARCAIVYVHRDEPKARFMEADEADLERGLSCFDGLLAYWQAKNKYAP